MDRGHETLQKSLDRRVAGLNALVRVIRFSSNSAVRRLDELVLT